MMKALEHVKRCRPFALLGLWTCFCVAVTGIYVQASSETAMSDVQDETLTEISGDGIYAMGGFSYEATQEDFVTETESGISIAQWESDGESDTDTDGASAEADIQNALDNYETIVEFSTDTSTASYTVSKSEVSSLVNGFFNDHPEYFYVSQVSYVSLTNGLVKRLIFTFTDTTEQLTCMRAEYERSIEEAMLQVDLDQMSEAQACAVIHDYLAELCEYEYDTTNAYRYSAYGALVEGKAVCQGYALAYQDILNRLGIACITIASDDMNHAWNMVEIDDYYYHVDVTWDDTLTIPGQVYHSNLLLSKAGIEDTGHYGYSVSSEIKNNTATTYMNEFWQNVTSLIYYDDGALYYIYPENVSDTFDVSDEQTEVKFLFIKKPAGDSDTQNTELLCLRYAVLKAKDDDVSDSVLSTLAGKFTYYARLVKDEAAWYINTAGGIYSVAIDTAKEADAELSASEVFRLTTFADGDTLVCDAQGAVDQSPIYGLFCDGSALFYQTEGGALTEVSGCEVTEPDADSLYVYEAQDTLVLSLGDTYQLHAYILPQAASGALTYASSASGYVSVDADTGLLQANAYTDGNPVTITITVPQTDCTAVVQVEVEHVSVTNLLLSNASVSLTQDDTKQLRACVTPGNATCKDVEYLIYASEPESEGEEVVSVDENGFVTALHAGTAIIRASVEDVFYQSDGSKTSSVYYADCKFSVTASEETSETDADADTGTDDDTDADDTCDVQETGEASTETSVSVSGVSLNVTSFSMKMLQIKTLTAAIVPASASNQELIWTSSDHSVVTVSQISDTLDAEVAATGVGTAVVSVTTADGAYVAACEVTVGKRSVAKAVTSSIKNKTYTGSAIKPTVTVLIDGVKLKKNRDYKISYKNNKKIGTATITIKGIGNYTGTKKITFQIVPAAPSAKVTVAAKSVLVTYEKVSEADGYQIVYAKNKTYTKSKVKINVKQNLTFAYRITGLRAKTKYFVKIRSYKVVNGKKIYSAFYHIGKIKTK